jgi:glycosyltransferase involved in cell wall biosynthesis
MPPLLKALVVLAQPPSFEGTAPARCSAALLRGLAAHDVEATALAPRPAYAAGHAVAADLNVELVELPETHARWADALHRVRYPRGSLLGPFAERVRELSHTSDVVHLEETETAWCDLGLARPSSLHMHFRVLRDRRLGAPWRNEFRFVLEFAAAEVVAARRHRFLVASSPRIAMSLRKLNSKAEVVVAPLALEPSHYERAALTGPPVAGLIGSGDWPPTRNAILRLTTHIWPAVRRHVPEARLVIAGRRTKELEGPADAANGIEFRGEIESASAFFTDLSLLLYPLDRGSGMKVKVLEALVSGVPVVTTGDGAEGVVATDGVLVRTGDEDLAAAAVELLRDEHARVERGAAARLAFEANYTPSAAAEPIAALFRRMAEATA